MSFRADDVGNTIPEVDVLTLLSMDHQRARVCLATLSHAAGCDVELRASMVPVLITSLRAHLLLEEELLDPPFLAASSSADDLVMLKQGRAVHENVRQVLDHLEHKHPGTSDCRALILALRDLVDLHSESQETALFPRARALLEPPELVELAARLRQRRKEIGSSGTVGGVPTRSYLDDTWDPGEPEVSS